MNFQLCQAIVANIARVIVGKEKSIELLLVALLAEGHVLIEDIPGLGKTLIAKSLAKSIGGNFKRVQFTPDLLPSDVTGFNIYHQPTGQFVFQPGPVMTNILLADEINRTIPRTQSSLLESMEEHQVTVDGKTYAMPQPFLVLATQNPIELEGTFPLPEAQLDRFLLRVRLGYPERAEELAMMDRFRESDPLVDLQPVAHPDQIVELQNARRTIRISSPVKEYIADVVRATRENAALRLGASPRATLALMRAGQALAILRERDYVLPDDIKYLAAPILAHRLVLKDEERMRGESLGAIAEKYVQDILTQVPVPTE